MNQVEASSSKPIDWMKSKFFTAITMTWKEYLSSVIMCASYCVLRVRRSGAGRPVRPWHDWEDVTPENNISRYSRCLRAGGTRPFPLGGHHDNRREIMHHGRNNKREHKSTEHHQWKRRNTSWVWMMVDKKWGKTNETVNSSLSNIIIIHC